MTVWEKMDSPIAWKKIDTTPLWFAAGLAIGVTLGIAAADQSSAISTRSTQSMETYQTAEIKRWFDAYEHCVSFCDTRYPPMPAEEK